MASRIHDHSVWDNQSVFFVVKQFSAKVTNYNSAVLSTAVLCGAGFVWDVIVLNNIVAIYLRG